MEQTPLGQGTSQNRVTNLVFSNDERQVTSKLAGEAGELSARPVEAGKLILWTRHNDLESVRPLIFCDPENGWNEIILMIYSFFIISFSITIIVEKLVFPIFLQSLPPCHNILRRHSILDYMNRGKNKATSRSKISYPSFSLITYLLWCAEWHNHLVITAASPYCKVIPKFFFEFPGIHARTINLKRIHNINAGLNQQRESLHHRSVIMEKDIDP